MALMVVSVFAGAAAAAGDTTVDDPDKINSSATAVATAQIPVEVTKDVHRVGDWSAIEYESDSGTLSSLNASVNESAKNPVTLLATDINFSDAGAFPHGDSNASALDASEWTTSGLTVSETSTASGVDALGVATNGSMASGNTASASYTMSVDSDENKRYVQIFADVSTLDSATHATVRVVDQDGDYKRLIIDADNSTNAASVLANSTGEGFVSQRQLGKLTTQTVSGSDGTFDNIRSVEVHVQDGDLDAAFSVINIEKMSKYVLGEQKADTDNDGTKDETRTVYEPAGAYGVTSFDTLGGAFSDAVVHNADIAMNFSTADLSKETDAHVEFTTASGWPDFKWMADVYYRLELPAAYDLSYSNAELTSEVTLPASRYQTVEVAEGVGDTDFKDISSWTDVTSKFDSRGETVTLDSTIQSGQAIGLHFEYPVTDTEKGNFVQTGGAVGQFASSASGWTVFGYDLTSLPVIGSLISLVGVVLGGKLALNR
ncbi:hypothetical protein [Halarchaeum sp. P4]|uniref:hypothetical protein n=1 Tax=Halarchaeum sp. P4 TaxID=3421639 RepID=UPI003EB94439